jgi:uncharacterized protein YprB with RNaseH-like and TPR domain
MLTNTFCHMPGIGARVEQRLWAAGILSWEHAFRADSFPVSGGRAAAICRSARESIEELSRRNAAFFADNMRSSEHWRLFPEFRNSVAYIDIETTGLGHYGDYITSIALYDGADVRWYVHGENLEEFAEDIRRYRLLVSYNGKTFDVPFIRNYLRIPMEQAHIDLRYVLKSLGYTGGLKGCERKLGLDRGELDGVDGYFAVLLWNDYIRNDNRGALDSMLAYNIADAVNLEALMVMAYNMKLAGTAFESARRLPLPEAPPSPVEPDMETVNRIRRDHGWL